MVPELWTETETSLWGSGWENSPLQGYKQKKRGRFWLGSKLFTPLVEDSFRDFMTSESTKITPTRVVVTHHILKRENTPFC